MVSQGAEEAGNPAEEGSALVVLGAVKPANGKKKAGAAVPSGRSKKPNICGKDKGVCKAPPSRSSRGPAGSLGDPRGPLETPLGTAGQGGLQGGPPGGLVL
ncbi:hypothetical protein N2152v2_001647 [Parachlorella kessleri]